VFVKFFIAVFGFVVSELFEVVIVVVGAFTVEQPAAANPSDPAA
jgi:hypothetical protein